LSRQPQRPQETKTKSYIPQTAHRGSTKQQNQTLLKHAEATKTEADRLHAIDCVPKKEGNKKSNLLREKEPNNQEKGEGEKEDSPPTYEPSGLSCRSTAHLGRKRKK